MSTLQMLSYKQNEVRMVMQDDGPWWVLADVCKVLGLTTPARVHHHHRRGRRTYVCQQRGRPWCGHCVDHRQDTGGGQAAV